MAGFSNDVRHALRKRVAKQVEGRGITRSQVDSAVDRVVAALPSVDGAGVAAAPRPDDLVATFSAVSAPDLASRIRQSLADGGLPVIGFGSATVGRHTVVAVRMPAAAEGALDSLAARVSASLSVVTAAAESP
ncbi:MAG TPA: hypothetical protein VMM18_00230 [Gemmatimonadaceae bacterium]|nr:hypothetical protein [Gemmatimonadaceae bacterium]